MNKPYITHKEWIDSQRNKPASWSGLYYNEPGTISDKAYENIKSEPPKLTSITFNSDVIVNGVKIRKGTTYKVMGGGNG